MIIPDKLLINLKILSKIQKNGRIARSYDGIISLENDNYYQPIRRFLSNDSRKQAIVEINSIVNECITVMNNIINSRYMAVTLSNTDDYSKGCESLELLLGEFNEACKGIDNLKFTYQNDYNIATQLDIMLLKISSALKDFYSKLYFYKSYLPENQISTPFQPSTPMFIPEQKPNIDNSTLSPLSTPYDLSNIKIEQQQNTII